MATAGLSDPGRDSWLEVEPNRRSWETRFCVPGAPRCSLRGWLLLAWLSKVLSEAVIKHGVLGCESSTKSQSGCEDHRSVEAGWMAGHADLGAPALCRRRGSPQTYSALRSGHQTAEREKLAQLRLSLLETRDFSCVSDELFAVLR